MKINNKQFDILISKIDTLIKVITITSNLPSDFRDKTKKEQIKYLYEINPKFDRGLIAIIVGTTPETISVRLSELRKEEVIKWVIMREN